MGMVDMSITEAAINESIDVLAAYKSVTNVRLYREIVLGFTLDVDRIALAPSCGCTDGPVLVDVVADFREDLVSCDCICITALRRTDTDIATYVNLCVCCNCDECNCKCH